MVAKAMNIMQNIKKKRKVKVHVPSPQIESMVGRASVRDAKLKSNDEKLNSAVKSMWLYDMI